MRKLLLLFVLLLVVASVYVILPGSVDLRKSTLLAANGNAFARAFPDTAKWRNWWPSLNKNPGLLQTPFEYNGRRYVVTGQTHTSLQMQIAHDNDTLPSELFFIPLSGDSVRLEWTLTVKTSANPVTRITRYASAKRLEEDLTTLLGNMQAYYTKEANIYGVRIEKTFVTDSTLISTRTETKGYPSVETIYAQIDKLKSFAAVNGAAPSGLPMLSVLTEDSVVFRTQVALPVNKKLAGNGDIQYRWMLGGGNILVTEIEGGLYAVNHGFAQMEQYVLEHRRTAPAIPFQSLVTDRRKEKDTSKWVTKLYWPVM